ncbi:MAG: sigma-70 family RNA polymerase sigma factor [Clostridia bacterium]|nr:sigma-70 family RNA polymerase sigma factor [Clostridia bacterium]
MGNNLSANYLDLSDEKLVRLIRESDENAFKILYERYLPKIRTMTYSFQGLGYDIEDLVQEAIIGFFTAINVYDFKSSAFSTFCYTCMRRMLISLLRKMNKKKSLPSSSIIYTDENLFEEAISQDPETTFIAREDFERLKSRINAELSEFERDVLHYYLLDFNYAEISKALNTTKKSVDNAIQRIRQKLR